MRELPALFSTPMVQAILENRKTMTRRTKGLEKVNENQDDWEQIAYGPHPENDNDTRCYIYFRLKKMNTWAYCKPRYQVGDHIWVKETWRQNQFQKDIIMYKADTAYPEKFKWKSSLFMRKEYTRIWLEVTGVTCERLHDITEADAIAEGIKIIEDDEAYFDYEFNGENGSCATAKGSFYSLWNKINGKESFDLNPWVFVYEFKKIVKP